MSRIIWIRHGEHQNDVLTPTGRDQVEATVQDLLARFGRPQAIYHSGALRAQESAQIAAQITGLAKVHCHAGAHYQGVLSRAYGKDLDQFKVNPEPYWQLASEQVAATNQELAEVGELIWVFSHGLYFEAGEPSRPCPEPGGFLVYSVRRCLH